MSQPFDATLKDLVESFTRDYEAQLNLGGPGPLAPLTPLNVDLSTVTASTDIVLGRGNPPTAVVVLDFQSARTDDLPSRLLLYNALAYHRYRVPVHTLVVLLRPAANDRRLDEGLHYAVWPERGRTDIAFEVVRLWEQPLERFLAGGLGTLPLAPLCQLPEGSTLQEALPGIIRRIHERLTQEARPEDGAKLWAATYVLTGLRLPRQAAAQLSKESMA
jgi:hypothetical protein